MYTHMQNVVSEAPPPNLVSRQDLAMASLSGHHFPPSLKERDRHPTRGEQCVGEEGSSVSLLCPYPRQEGGQGTVYVCVFV